MLEEEVAVFVKAAPYQRSSGRRDYRNENYERDLGTSPGMIEDVRVPRTRGGFRTELIKRYQRRQAELDEAICELFLGDVSTIGMGDVIEALSSTHPSPSTVSRIFHSLDEEFKSWKSRRLQAHYLYVFSNAS